MGNKIVLVLWAVGALLAIGATGCGREHIQSVELTNKCVEYSRREMYPQAIRDCSKAISLDPENEKAHHNLALIYIATKEYEQAARQLQKAIAVNDKIALYHYQLGEVYHWSGQPPQAASELQRAVELDSTLYKAHYWLGRAYQDMEEPQKAMQKYTDAIMGNPRFYDAYRDLGLLYADYGFASQAEQVLSEGIKALEGRGDELAVLHHIKGTVFADNKDYEAAIKEFRTALDLNPAMDDAMFSLGWSYSYVNRENAKLWLEKFVSSAAQPRPDYMSAAQARLFDLRSGAPIQ